MIDTTTEQKGTGGDGGDGGDVSGYPGVNARGVNEKSDSQIANPGEPGTSPPSPPSPPFDGWLYFTPEIDTEFLPSPSTSPTVQIGSKVFYRLTLDTLVWLEKACTALKPDRRAVLNKSICGRILPFIESRFADAEVKQARSAGSKPLPAHPEF